jgi:hypothetical protein
MRTKEMKDEYKAAWLLFIIPHSAFRISSSSLFIPSLLTLTRQSVKFLDNTSRLQ